MDNRCLEFYLNQAKPKVRSRLHRHQNRKKYVWLFFVCEYPLSSWSRTKAFICIPITGKEKEKSNSVIQLFVLNLLWHNSFSPSSQDNTRIGMTISFQQFLGNETMERTTVSSGIRNSKPTKEQVSDKMRILTLSYMVCIKGC